MVFDNNVLCNATPSHNIAIYYEVAITPPNIGSDSLFGIKSSSIVLELLFSGIGHINIEGRTEAATRI